MTFFEVLQRIAGADDCFALFSGKIYLRVLVGLFIGREQVGTVDYTREESATQAQRLRQNSSRI